MTEDKDKTEEVVSEVVSAQAEDAEIKNEKIAENLEAVVVEETEMEVVEPEQAAALTEVEPEISRDVDSKSVDSKSVDSKSVDSKSVDDEADLEESVVEDDEPKIDDQDVVGGSEFADLFGYSVLGKMRRQFELLHTYLNGKAVLNLTESRKSFTFDFSQRPLSMVAEAISKPDCSITVADSVMKDLIKGNLNPQIAMISDKVSIDGKTEILMYFFNLFAGTAPRGRR